MSTPHSPAAGGSILRQPLAVWAVAFAAVIAFMGIGLVDPILPAIAESLEATPTETSLLFTSYLVITGVVMFFTSWLSSRIGAKKTLMIGLVLIVVFAALAGTAGSVEGVIGFRAGWGFGNALFISTALSTIVGAASGGSSAAIVLYEAALGVGIAIGPLLGGLLGSVSWRGPFFGTAVLMAVGFIAIATLLREDGPRPTPTPLSAPFKALAVPAIRTLAGAALFYNIGFFVLLAYTPYPLGLDEMGLGFTFFGWGLGVAITSVFVAPLLTARLPRTVVLRSVLVLLALDLVAGGLLISSRVGLIVCIIVGGLLLGVVNTVLTECVMEATDLPRSVASSSYSGVRFLGGAIAPPAASALAAAISPAFPMYAAAGAVLIASLIVFLGRRTLARADAHGAESAAVEAQSIAVGESL
ncbi:MULTISPECIES: MFS transporter [unclassified Rathayibacter]|uniref:MFS transporter n=1 Tax=unclassified Rathayibacter TaxID=2609250 RepID=UPI000F46BA52|nr:MULTISPECIES: MFS transporter [unclassified Rathayibacter]MCJ1702402.1 MFS transporter [Rathayibacter sp. VKM Ac-2926]ROP56937.1 putative MFS family arabinose efflux permease [Rathayibacter sp. PhB186]ROQ15617.1 putative MFS family arabinose efflux permease [Rathayibacter sp. PhB93]ROQ50548.1 putative MFS family arabinose efflux permease [Rathayibacter sp. PhB152]ROS28405.1 putative MFS family arabinose efflux permease [Rathayibacter sp. PhB127]